MNDLSDKALKDTAPFATITNRGPDHGLGRVGVKWDSDLAEWDPDTYSALSVDILAANADRLTVWADGDRQDAQLKVVHVAAAWWAVWEDGVERTAEAYDSLAAAEAQYERYVADSASLSVLGPPDHTDVADVDTIPEGHHRAFDDDGNIIIIAD